MLMVLFFRIRSFDGERDALAFFINAKDDELPWPLLAGNAWSLYHKPPYTGRNELRMNDF